MANPKDNLKDKPIPPVGPPGLRGRPGFGSKVEKAQNFRATMRQLIAYLRPYWLTFCLVFFFGILSTLFAILSPRLLGNMTNQVAEDFIKRRVYDEITIFLPTELLTQEGITLADVLPNLPPLVVEQIPAERLQKISDLDFSSRPDINWSFLGRVASWLIGLYLSSAVFAFLQGWLMAGIAQDVTYQLRTQLSVKINRLPLAYFDKHNFGEVLSRITNDVDTVGQTLNQSLSQIISSVLTLLGIMIMMFSISWQLALIALLVLPVSLLTIRGIIKNSQQQFKSQQKQLGQLNGHVEEMYAGHLVMKVFNGEKASVEKFRLINQQLHNSSWRAQFLSGLMMPVMHLIGNFGYVGVAVAGGYLAVAGSLNIGDIQAFIQYMRQFNRPIVQTANMANVLQSTAAAAERVFMFLEENEEKGETDIVGHQFEIKGAVEFEQIEFAYELNKPVIKGFSAQIQPGQRVAIVGPTGAGKTTLVNLLMRFYELDAGAIRIDGQDISQLKRAQVRSIFGMVLQDTWLKAGTIRENIMYGNPQASEQEMLSAAKAAQVDHFVCSLPGGYDYVLGEDTDNISQGEKQLITIARAMLAHKPLLILDEATSSVDTRTEVLIQKAMRNLLHGKTSFVIAHRLSTIRDADLILVVKDGNIVEQGTHQELLEARGFYAELYQSQFAGKEVA